MKGENCRFESAPFVFSGSHHILWFIKRQVFFWIAYGTDYDTLLKIVSTFLNVKKSDSIFQDDG